MDNRVDDTDVHHTHYVNARTNVRSIRLNY